MSTAQTMWPEFLPAEVDPRELTLLGSCLMSAKTSQSLQQALTLLRQGRRVEGETLLVRAVDAARQSRSLLGRLRGAADGERATPSSPAHAAALFDLGRYLLACDDPQRAVSPLRVASALEPSDAASTRDRLTYGMNLGETLQLAGHLEEAEAVLRANVEERRSFYGEGSEGLAWGLEPLADVLLAQDRLTEAAELASQALEILWKGRLQRRHLPAG